MACVSLKFTHRRAKYNGQLNIIAERRLFGANFFLPGYLWYENPVTDGDRPGHAECAVNETVKMVHSRRVESEIKLAAAVDGCP